MKIFVLIVVLVSVVSAEDNLKPERLIFEWTGHVKTLVDTANYTEDDVLEITRNIFGDMPMNCGGRIGMPNKTHIPSPTEDCDLEILDDLTKRLFKGYNNDYQEFLKKFWSSDVGQRFLKEIEIKGVSEDLVKMALEETWFTKSTLGDYPFNKIFLEADNVRGESAKKLQTWYTFNNDYQNRSNCKIDILGENLPVVVKGTCEGENKRIPSIFVIPNHPFVDLVLYSICAWSKLDDNYGTVRECPVIIPGSTKIFDAYVSTRMDSQNKGFLVYVNIVESYKNEVNGVAVHPQS